MGSRDQSLVSKIRRISGEEKSSFKRSERLEWVQLCPFCDIWVGSLVDHVKTAHSDRSSRQIRTKCPYEECAKMIVDVKNHMKTVHAKVRNFKCEECPSSFTSNHQMMKHVEAVHTNLKVECVECGGKYKTTTLPGHIRRIHRGMKPAVPCREPDCQKVFGSKADLERHVMGVHMKWKTPCPECGKRMRVELLMKHVKTAHRGIHNIKCQECGQGFQSQKGLIKHVRVQHRGTFIYCRATTKKGLECGKILHSEEGLINHVECKHLSFAPDIVQVACSVCSTQVPACYLSHHVTSVHTNPDQWECPVKNCGARKSDLNGLKEHVHSDHHTLGLEWCSECAQFVLQKEEHWKLQHEVELPFRPVYGVCVGQLCGWEGCSFMSTSPTHLTGHVKSKHQEFVKCEDCGKRVDNIEEHARMYHAKSKTLPCEDCDKLFLTQRLLNMHKKRHTKCKDICNECGVAVKKLRQHKRFVHEKDLRFKCEQPGCETKFSSNCAVQKHFEQVHQKMRVECKICQKKVSNLKNHIKIVHEKIRDYVCIECHKSFQSKTHLRNHISRVHIGIQEECTECGKMVKNLKNHISFVHNKITNFQCDQCSKKFVTSTDCKKHISSVHLKEKISCPECGVKVSSAHLGMHVRRKHSGKVKIYFTCKQCEVKFFLTRGQLAKHVMRVHMGIREKCTICGLMTKDLKRHNKNTNCSRDGYVVRRSSVKTEYSSFIKKCDVKIMKCRIKLF